MSKEHCSLCHTGFRDNDVICHSPIYHDDYGVFHETCMKRVEEIIDLEGTNDISHIIYPSNAPPSPVVLLEVFLVRFAYKDASVTEHPDGARMHQHPGIGNLVRFRGYDYRVTKVVYDMDHQTIDVGCELE